MRERWTVKLGDVSCNTQKTETGVLAFEANALAHAALFILATHCRLNQAFFLYVLMGILPVLFEALISLRQTTTKTRNFMV